MESTKRNTSIWIDKDLAKIIKHKYNKSNINKELESFLQSNKFQTDNNIEVTIESMTETKTITKFLKKLNNKVNELYESTSSLRIKTTDIGIKLICDTEYTADNACDCFSDYFATLEKSEQQIQKKQKQENLDNLIKEDLLRRRIKQMIQFYQIDEKNLNLYNSKKKAIKFLLDHIKSNKDIVEFLAYKNIQNKHGKLYTTNSIATKRYRYKKNKISNNDR